MAVERFGAALGGDVGERAVDAARGARSLCPIVYVSQRGRRSRAAAAELARHPRAPLGVGVRARARSSSDRAMQRGELTR